MQEIDLDNPSGGSSRHYWVTTYWIGYWMCFALVFLGCWIYCISSYGFLLGVGLGWLPSAITAFIVSLVWPLVVAGLIFIAYTLRHG
jgi:hypothetical protein